jgi:hypothetical protein
VTDSVEIGVVFNRLYMNLKDPSAIYIVSCPIFWDLNGIHNE